jgi:hypothetical protein
MFPVLPYGFPTPDSLPEETVCRTLTIPNETVFLACFMGALRVLAEAENWQQTGSVTPEEAAAAAFEIIDQAYNSMICPVETVDTPYWDDSTDVDDEEAIDDQPWYGKVEDPSVPPDELTFIEDAAIWAFTGLLAVATIAEVGPAPAIAFRTIAPKFVVAIRTGDLGRIIRLFVDGSEAARVEDDGSGDIVEMPVIADPDIETHQIYITAGAA